MIDEISKLNKVTILDSKFDECEKLQKICTTWDDKRIIEGEEFEPDYIYKCLTKGDLPPISNANKANYRLKSIYLKDTDELIGFTDMYYGYPSPEVVWISIFIIDKKYRKNKYAQDAIKLISDKSREKGYEKIGVGVHLKNWGALRFWTKAGFNQIFGIFGDNTYSTDNFAIIGLEKSLK